MGGEREARYLCSAPPDSTPIPLAAVVTRNKNMQRKTLFFCCQSSRFRESSPGSILGTLSPVGRTHAALGSVSSRRREDDSGPNGTAKPTESSAFATRRAPPHNTQTLRDDGGLWAFWRPSALLPGEREFFHVCRGYLPGPSQALGGPPRCGQRPPPPRALLRGPARLRGRSGREKDYRFLPRSHVEQKRRECAALPIVSPGRSRVRESPSF